jgi:hypothetical protein
MASQYVDLSKPSLWIATASIIFVSLSPSPCPTRRIRWNRTTRRGLLQADQSTHRTLSSGTSSLGKVRLPCPSTAVVLLLLLSPPLTRFPSSRRVQEQDSHQIRVRQALLGCYALAVAIFSLGILRDHLSVLFSLLRPDETLVDLVLRRSYHQALAEQPTAAFLHYTEFKILAAVLFAVGGTLVVSSMVRSLASLSFPLFLRLLSPSRPLLPSTRPVCLCSSSSFCFADFSPFLLDSGLSA